MGSEASSSSVTQPSTAKEKVKDRKRGGSLQTGIGFGCHFWEIPSGRTLGWPVSGKDLVRTGVGWGGGAGILVVSELGQGPCAGTFCSQFWALTSPSKPMMTFRH